MHLCGTRLRQSRPRHKLAWRGVFGALGLGVLIIITKRGKSWAQIFRFSKPGWVFVVVSAVCMVFFITALKETTVAHVAVIYATIPFCAATLGWLVLGEQPEIRAIFASLAAFAGVVIMVGLGTEGTLFGDFLAFAMTLGMAVLMIIVRRHPEIAVMPAACLSALFSSIICWPFGAPLEVSSQDLLLIALLGIMVSAVGIALFALGAKFLPPVETALIGSLDAPLAPFWIWIVFGEIPSNSTLIGGSIVFGAVVLHVLSSASKVTLQSA